MDITTYNTVRAFAEAGIRERNFKPDPSKFNTIPAGASKPLSPAERTVALQQRAEMDKHAAESRAFIKKQYGTDPMVQNKVEHKPMTEEEQATYVQAWMDRLMEGDAKYQKHLEYTRQNKAEALALARQNPVIDTSA